MTGVCPNCGAPLAFGGAQSLAAVCAHCRSAVVRAGADLFNIGKVPDLVATGSRLALHARGAVDGKPFSIIGHLQLGRSSGPAPDAVWDEWYISFDDGSWGWLAEAQGRLLFTRPVPKARLPAVETLHPGQRIDLGEATVVIDEVNEGSFAAAEGELPYQPRLNDTYRFADCSDASGGFYTLDYGAEGDTPQLYAGRELAYAGAGLERFQSSSGRHPEGHALTCPNCGANIGLKVVSSESVACPSCKALLDITQQPARLLAQLKGRTKPPLPLGAKGVIATREYEVIGWMKRKTVIGGSDYFWDEYLLHGAAGYRWLTESAGHWLFMEPIPAGRIQGYTNGLHATFDGRSYKHFESNSAYYEELQGEFYWRIEAGQRVDTADYVSPPHALSKETSKGEVNWSHGEFMTGAEVWSAFKQPGSPPKAHGVGAAQPNPYSNGVGRVWKTALIALAVVGMLALLFSSRKKPVLELAVGIADAGEPVTLSQPFELTGGPQAVEIDAKASVDQAWIGLDVALINDESGESDAVGFELSHYHGTDSDGAWSEGNRSGSAVIGSVPAGRYVLRVEPEWQKEPNGSLPLKASVVVSRGAFVKDELYLAIALILLWPVMLLIRQHRFETRRWADSDHPRTSG